MPVRCNRSAIQNIAAPIVLAAMHPAKAGIRLNTGHASWPAFRATAGTAHPAKGFPFAGVNAAQISALHPSAPVQAVQSDNP